jgi:hypothetical protein
VWPSPSRPRCALALIAALGLSSAAAHAPTAFALGDPPVRSGPYGLIASNANFVPGSTPAERTASYRRLYDAGVRVIRMDIRWTDVQPAGSAPDHFDFSGRDREVAAARDAGLKILGILCCGHPDYSSRGNAVNQTPLSGGLPPFQVGASFLFPPDNPADFARYARAAAQHFAADAVGWEVWNEENEGWRFWPPHEDPAAYAKLLCATYPQLKAVDPQAPVLFGGVFFPAVAAAPGMSGPDFLAATYAAEPSLGHCFDAMAYHPYPYPFTAPELDVPVRGSVLAAADAMRAVLDANGDHAKALWITEVGWPTHDRTYGVSEEKQGQYMARMLAATFAQGVPVLTWYTYGDETDPTGGANQEAWFGLFRADNSPKPAYVALRTFSSVFAGASFLADRSRALGLPPGQQNVGGRGFALAYRRPGYTITAVWLASESAGEAQGQTPSGGSASAATTHLALPVASDRVTVLDYLGAPRSLTATGGRVNLTVGPGPQYVIDADSPAGATFEGFAAQLALAGTHGLVALPASRARRCGSRRAFVIHVRRRRGWRVTGVSLYVNGHLARRVSGRALRAPVDLRGLPRGRVRVKVVVRAVTGRGARRRQRVLVGTRVYRTCVSRRRA